MTAAGREILRAAIFHTPRNPFHHDGACEEFHDGALLVDGPRIEAAGDYAAIRAAHPGAPVRDLRGGVLLPGFVDLHTHFPQARIIGGLGYTLLDWLERHALPEEARMTDSPYAQTVADGFVYALASHGTTTALVFGAHFQQATAALFEAAAAAGLRIASGLVLSDRALRPELHQTPDAAYRASKQLIGCYHGQGRLTYAVTPRFAISASEAMLEVCRALIAEHPGVLFQTHLNENSDEIREAARLFPGSRDYLDIYERFGLSGPRSVFAHNVHPRADELSRLAARNAAVAHCPCSNAALGSGFFPLRRHVDAGVRFGLGTDVGGGTGFGMLKEGLQAYLLQRLAPEPAALTPAQLLYLITRAGAEALGMDARIGDFESGKAADFVYLRPRPNGPLALALAHAESAQQMLAALFALGNAEDIREVRVDGAVVYP